MTYEIKNEIPLLYTINTDKSHLIEEENLARMMTFGFNKKEEFSRTQWKNSKVEFWNMVRQNIGPAPKAIVNIGCGYDTNFTDFENKGYFFVNFDMVYSMLHYLKTNSAAKNCVAGDILFLPFKKNAFDYVVCVDVVHHESNKLEYLLKSIRGLLKPGGILFLEDPNAWGMFQFIKSILLPRSLYSSLRTIYHRLKRSDHRPADYEFPTNVWEVKKILRDIGFGNIKVYPNDSYPSVGRLNYKIYKLFKKNDWIKTYHNYHYMISAVNLE
ncbi:MAG: class I SAM-dependent methyltransferase [Candidatus Omnitrophota bacterium]